MNAASIIDFMISVKLIDFRIIIAFLHWIILI